VNGLRRDLHPRRKRAPTAPDGITPHADAIIALSCRKASTTPEAICNSPALRRTPPGQTRPEDDFDYLRNCRAPLARWWGWNVGGSL
jgi:hypothetical protein